MEFKNKYVKKIKNNNLYKIFLFYIIIKIYNFFWHNILNFNGRVLYFIWKIKSKDNNFFNLDGNDKKVIKNNSYFKDISDEIYNYCEKNLLEKSKEELLNNSSELDKNPTNSGKNSYSQDLFERLPFKIKRQIFKLAHSDLLINSALNYLKVFPIIDKISLTHNIPKNVYNVRGAMLWHKDDFGYKSFDIFMAISDIDETSGPLMCVEEKNKYGIFYKNKHENISTNNFSKGERGKISTDYYENKNKKILKLLGKKGTALLIDSFTVYHRGGHCVDKDRLMLRISYQTPDAIRVSKEKPKYLDEFEKLELNQNFFIKYLYFKRPSNWILAIRVILMKFYRILHIKES